MADDLEVLMTDEESDVYGLVMNSDLLCHDDKKGQFQTERACPGVHMRLSQPT